ncbi:hypothetical protein Ciccas_005114 [Cichlidogyrus casuarinus]|uniref:Uncharacterized protein n=1 Tax=Cichlidogyrus casuarinus TaxID=1844966 RepID=A0ABD2QD42_9PLAT
MLGVPLQICLAHLLHLCVTEVIYSAAENPLERTLVAVSDSDDEEAEDDDLETEYGLPIPLSGETKEAVQALRKVVRKCRTTHALGCRIEALGFGRLILDVKVRWNSLIAMIRRFRVIHDKLKEDPIWRDVLRVHQLTPRLLRVLWMVEDSLVQIEALSLMLVREESTLKRLSEVMTVMNRFLEEAPGTIQRRISEAFFTRYDRQSNYSSLFTLLNFCEHMQGDLDEVVYKDSGNPDRVP